MEDFSAHLAGLGYHFSPILDGKLHRFPRDGSRDSAWMIGWLHSRARTNGSYVIAQFGDWRTGEVHEYVSPGIGGAEKKFAQDCIKEAKKKYAAEKTLLQKEAALKAKEIETLGSTTSTITDYLARKKIDQLYGALVDQSKSMLNVVMRNIAGETVGVQRIFDDGKKMFLKGQQVQGAYFQIGTFDETEIYICEGFATGCSIHMATKRCVIVAFNAGNLAPVAKDFRRQYPDLKMTICGDDDRKRSPNVGREKAEAAALASMSIVRFPRFATDEGTDFNDLHVNEGLDAVRDQLADEIEQVEGFRTLGYDGNSHFFYNLKVGDIFVCSSFTPKELFHLAPERFWNENYRSGDSDKTNWTRAANDLITASQSKGRFNPSDARGFGVWLDRGRTVVNNGTSLLVDGLEKPIHWCGEHVYISSKRKLRAMAEPLDDPKILIDVCSLLHWKDNRSKYLLPGWLALARIAGALPVRPHVWLTGGSGTGKSTVMTRIIDPSLGGPKSFLFAQGGTTEAGIRQTLKACSVPLILDEFESTTKTTKERHESIIELLRNTWSATNGQIVKGSAGGISTGFNLAFAALVSSIGVNLLTDADRSRFSILELSPHGDSTDDWSKLSSMLRHITNDFGERLFARSVKLLPTILKNYDVFQSAIAKKSRQRTGQQLGMLLAGYTSLITDRIIDEDDAEWLVCELDLETEKAERVSEEIECLNHLLTYRVTLDQSARFSMTVGEILKLDPHVSNNADIRRELTKYGVIMDEEAIYISDSHASLKMIFSNTRWNYWYIHLRRLPDAVTIGCKRFGGELRQRATKIPLRLITND